MSSREPYAPGAAYGAEVRKDGEKWTLVLVRDLPHPPAKVWEALTDPEQLREWAPFDSDRNPGAVATARLSTAGAPTPHVTETHVKRADAPKVLEFSWGGQVRLPGADDPVVRPDRSAHPLPLLAHLGVG